MLQGFMNFWDQQGWVANLIEIATLIFSIMAWVQSSRVNHRVREDQMRQEKLVTIKLTNGGRLYETPTKLRGAEVTRGEVLGRIGMIPIDPKNKIVDRGFSLEYTARQDFLRRLNEVQDETSDTILEIPCSDKEFDQFSFPE